MITELELSGWRAYDHVKIAFQPGTTFVVARNGVGKTSLLQGAAFALFGDRSGYGTLASVRSGFAEAMAAATVAIPDGRTISIRRTLTARKRIVEVFVDGERIDEAKLDALLSGAFGADVADLGRLSILAAGALQDYNVEKLHMHSHLCHLFGVDHLQAVAGDVRELRAATKSEVRKLREVKRNTEAEVLGWRQELERLKAELAQTTAQAATQRKRLEETSALIDLAAENEQFEHLRREHNDRLETIRSELVDFDGRGVDTDLDIAEILTELDQQTADRLATLERDRGRLEGRVELLEATRQQLEEADAECPVCLRPLDPPTREHAYETHVTSLEAQRAAIGSLVEEIGSLSTRRQGLARLRRTLAGIPPLPAAPAGVDPAEVADARQIATTLGPEIEQIDETAATLRVRIKNLQSQLDDEAERARQHQRSVAAYRREALTEAALAGVSDMTERLITEKIDPLAALVTSRWKTVFRGSRPVLQLDANGELKLVRDSSEIAFSDMSAGERAVALLVTRLLVLSVTAPSAFLWLDEPLEQLDPANRRLVAQLLAGSSGGPVRQLVVTTFEEEIARRLEKAFDGVHVEYVTAAD